MDLISRQDAIEAIKEDKIDLTNPNVVAVFKATGDFEKVETQVMTCDRHIEILKDLPSAQLKSYRSYCEGYQAGFNEGYQAGFKDAQSERERGRWIPNIYPDVGDGYRCSQCGKWHVVKYNFCHNCGADMREVDDERPD